MLGDIMIIMFTAIIVIIIFICTAYIYCASGMLSLNQIIIKKCLLNIRDGCFDIPMYVKKYKSIFSTMYTYRSLNTYCRMNLDRVMNGTTLQFIQNDKIYFHKFLQHHRFSNAPILFFSRVKPQSIELHKLLRDHFSSDKMNKDLILKPSNLSFSEGVVIIDRLPSLQDIEKYVNTCFTNSCSFTEGGNSLTYDSKVGVIIQEMLPATAHVINEWKIMYIWGVPIIIHWKVGHKHRYKIMNGDFNVIHQSEKCFGLKTHEAIPSFAVEMLLEGERLCKLVGCPFLRVDILWNDDGYILNEVEVLPSNYMFPKYERLIMLLLQIPFNDAYTLPHAGYEMFSNMFYIFHYIEHLLRRSLWCDNLYKN